MNESYEAQYYGRVKLKTRDETANEIVAIMIEVYAERIDRKISPYRYKSGYAMMFGNELIFSNQRYSRFKEIGIRVLVSLDIVINLPRLHEYSYEQLESELLNYQTNSLYNQIKESWEREQNRNGGE